MPAELFVVLAAGLVVLQMASVILRRAFADERSYLLLLAADLAALSYVYATGRTDFYMWVPVVVAGVLTFAPRLLERRESVAVERGDLGTARFWAVAREWVVPGRGSSARRRQIDDLIEVHTEGSQAVARRLRERIAQTTDLAEAEALHEELVAMLLVDSRFAEATEQFGRHLGPVFLLRRPGLLPQLIHAWGELGDITSAATVLAALEASPLVREPSAFPLLMRARLLLLAYAGWETVPSLLEGPAGMVLHPREREQVAQLARSRALTQPPLAPEVNAALRLSAMRAEEVQLRRRKPPRVTLALIAINVVIQLVLWHIDGGSGNEIHGGTLARAGALFRPAVLSGEWWHAVSAMFLHGGWAHLGMNMYGLYILGRFVEELCGGLRCFVIYFLAGLFGAAASTLVGKGALSVGASGAIMGLLGSVIVLVVLRRGSFSDRWRRLLLWNLAIIVAVQLVIDRASQVIDGAAHIGGLVGGALMTELFAPGLLLGNGKLGRAIVRGVAAACVALSIFTVVQIARTPLPVTLAKLPTKSVELNGLRLTVPRHWEIEQPENKNVAPDRVVDPYLDIELTVSPGKLSSPQADDPRYSALLRRILDSAAPVGEKSRDGQ